MAEATPIAAPDVTMDTPPTSSTTPHLHTYHCICNQLILASTHILSSLPRRQSPGLDKALILPLPPLPGRRRHGSSNSASSSSSEASSDDDEEDEAPEPPNTSPPERANKHKHNHKRGPKEKDAMKNKEYNQGYSLLLSTTLDRRPNIIRREDGFEKRWLWRCGRCRVVVGYQLDVVHYLTTDDEASQNNGAVSAAAGSTTGGNPPGELSGGGTTGVRQKPEGKVIYLFPGGLRSTEEMVEGKKVLTEEDLVLG
ncbi:MAG: hypothetical protein M1823_000070 [Watsoniomyces obsoletus]|nr:MAG: hypothetical protein M1823_000070 [Watsoniomyces obsoletus]